MQSNNLFNYIGKCMNIILYKAENINLFDIFAPYFNLNVITK